MGYGFIDLVLLQQQFTQREMETCDLRPMFGGVPKCSQRALFIGSFEQDLAKLEVRQAMIWADLDYLAVAGLGRRVVVVQLKQESAKQILGFVQSGVELHGFAQRSFGFG